jgi:hypothetical protein
MPKGKRKGQPLPARPVTPSLPMPPMVPPGFDPTGPSEPVDIVSSKEGWSEFTLQDGTVIRAKAVLLDVKKMINQFNPEGDPVYVMQIIMANQTRVPANLKRKKG